MKTMRFLPPLCAILLLLAGCCELANTCNNNEDELQDKLWGSVQCCFNNPNCGEPMETDGCEAATASRYYDESLGDVLAIRGYFTNGSAILLIIVWDGLSQNQTFFFDQDAADGGNYGTASFFPDIDAGENQVQYSSINRGGGSLKVTSLNTSRGRISGTFSFVGGKTVGLNMGSETAQISGSFLDVPIIDDNHPQLPCEGAPINNGGNNGGQSQATVSFQNTTFTTVSITLNGVEKAVDAGKSISFSGDSNTSFTGTATTSGRTSEGTQVGLKMDWQLSGVFPLSGVKNNELYVGPEYFFLQVVNNSSQVMNKLYVNHGLQSQTVDNISIPNNGQTYSIGYYRAFSNSNVRTESGNYYWHWSPLSLPWTNNQTATVTASR